MDSLYCDSTGKVARIYTTLVNPGDENSLEWIGINKSCDSVPPNALDTIDDLSYRADETEIDEFGRFKVGEWADQPDWYRAETPARGWIPLFDPADSEDYRPARWARDTKRKMPVVEVEPGKFKLEEAAMIEARTDLLKFRVLQEEIAEQDYYDAETPSPPLYDIERVELVFDSELEVQRMAMEAKRAILDIWGHVAWWAASVPSWSFGMDRSVVEFMFTMHLSHFRRRGYLISVNRDWKVVAFMFLIQNHVPIFYVWGLFEARDPRFARLDPKVISRYLSEVAERDVAGLWSDEIPGVEIELEEAARYDHYLQLKIHPYSRPRVPVPFATEVSGEVKYYVIDFQHWGRRLLVSGEHWTDLDERYHHIAVQSRSTQVTRVIFHRFHPKPKNVVMTRERTFKDEIEVEPNLIIIRERFKGRCAPRRGQIYDIETGIERQRPLGEHSTMEDVSDEADRETLLIYQGPNGWKLASQGQQGPDNSKKFDATFLGRELGPRTTAPSSNHSSERRMEDSSAPMAHTVGWVAAMARETWTDTVSNYTNRDHTHRPEIFSRAPSPDRDDVQSFYSTSGDSILARDRSPRREDSPATRTLAEVSRSRRIYPIHLPPAPPFRPAGESVSEQSSRRGRWLNAFADWGREATFNASLWRIPMEFKWNRDVLDQGYLLVSEVSEFRLRYLALTSPAIRFPRHLLEAAMERGIQFAIGFKYSDCDLFAPRDVSASRRVTKEMVDPKDKGPKLNSAPSVATVYTQFCGNLGRIAAKPQARCIIARGGGASWIMRAFLGVTLVGEYMDGPSLQVSVHRSGANDSGEADSIEVTWDQLSDGDYQAIFGYISGATPDKDTHLFPTDEIMEEFSDHYYGEWNPFCDITFRWIKSELDDKRGKCRTRKDWKAYFQSSNRGRNAPKLKVDRAFIDEGMEKLNRAFGGRWNKTRLSDIYLPEAFRDGF
ncbi:hypothetical protein B0H11DRAFT_2263202 [Mycena galericulata]|nr:hypothetical protein B0H11DRAFT_2263202 [Mycena galericulata]